MATKDELREYAAKLVAQFGHRNNNPDWDIIVEMRDYDEELTRDEVDEVYGYWVEAKVSVHFGDWTSPKHPRDE
jgi:hypothetical protein